MKFILIVLSFLLFSAPGLESNMKHREVFTIDTGLQAGIPIHDTGQGWLFACTSSDKFPNRICKVDESGKVLWFRNFVYKPVTVIAKGGGALLLDELGNFYEMDSSGTVSANLTEVVLPGRNVMAYGTGNMFYASGNDDSITCFNSDGNIEWISMGKSRATYINPITDGILVSEQDGAIVKYSLSGEEVWRVQVDAFSANMPIIFPNNDQVWGMRTLDGSKGKVVYIDSKGQKKWETAIQKGADWIYKTAIGYLTIGPLHSASIEEDGKIRWEQPFDLSKKLYPMGFINDGRLVLGILNAEGSDEALKIILLHPEGSMMVVDKIPVKKNTLVNVARRNRLIMLGLKDKIVVYRLLTMKEYIEQ